MPRVTLAALAVLALAASPALADESGTAQLQIDGQDMAFTLDAGQSDWFGSETYWGASIWLKPETRAGGISGLSLGFEYSGGKASTGELRLTVNGKPFYGNEDADEGGVSVTLESIAIDGKAVTLTGDVTGAAGPSSNFGRDIDLGAALPISGRFSVTLMQD